jgi:hypothetical protein
MGRIRFFANPESSVVKTFTVSDPDGQIDPDTGRVYTEEHHIELRTELSDREWSDLDMGVVSRATTDGELILDLSGAQYHHMATWIKAWSLTSDGGARVKPSQEQIGALLPAHAAIIWEIVRNHAADVKGRRDADTNPTVAAATAAGVSATPARDSLTLVPPAHGSSFPSDTTLEPSAIQG